MHGPRGREPLRPTLDPHALRALSAALEDHEAVALFAATYADLLDRRVERITEALLAQDQSAAMDGVLSLKVSSATVGARTLQALAGDLETLVRTESWVKATSVATHLVPAARAVRVAVQAFLASPRG